MVIKVMYCKPRKDGSCNYVLFDTEKKEIIDGYYGGDYVFVEAKMSKDVTNLREALKNNGYKDTIYI